MKTLMITLLICLTLGIFGQSYCISRFHYEPLDHTPQYVPALILAGTFLTINSLGYSASQNQRFLVALSGMFLSATAVYIGYEIKNHKRQKKAMYGYL